MGAESGCRGAGAGEQGESGVREDTGGVGDVGAGEVDGRIGRSRAVVSDGFSAAAPCPPGSLPGRSRAVPVSAAGPAGVAEGVRAGAPMEPVLGGASGNRAEAGGGGGLTAAGASGTADGRGRWARGTASGAGRAPRGVKTDGSSSGSSSGRGGVDGVGGRWAGGPGGVDGRRGTGAWRAPVLMHPPFPRARAVSSYAGRCRCSAAPGAETPSGHAYPYGRTGIPVHVVAGRVPPYVRVTLRVVRERGRTSPRTGWHLPGTSPYPAVILSGRLPS